MNSFQINIKAIHSWLTRAELKLIPLEGKRPVFNRWKDSIFDLEDFLLSPHSTKVTGFGVVCGKPSNVFVINIDLNKSEKKSGVEWWNRIAKQCFDDSHLKKVLVEDSGGKGHGVIYLPRFTLSIRTGSGGYHVYFKYDVEMMGDISNNGVGDVSVDVKTNGGYVVAPGSLHYISGCIYDVETGVIGGDIAEFIPCPTILLDSIRGNRTKKSIPSNRSLASATRRVPHRGISPEGLRELIDLIPPYLAVKRNDWRNGIFAISEAVASQNWEMTPEERYNYGLDLALRFSQLSPDNFDEEGTRKLWDETSHKSVANRKLTLGSIIYWVRQHEPNKFGHWAEKARYVSSECYDPNDEYYLLDYIEETKSKHFDSLEDAREFCLSRLSRFVRVIIQEKPRYVLRINPNIIHRVTSVNPIKSYSHFTLSYFAGRMKKNNEPVIEYRRIFDFLDESKLFCYDTRFFPGHPGEGDEEFKRKHGSRALNIFPGFQAKRLESYDAKYFERFLTHLKEVIADGDEETYDYLIKWLAYAIQYPRRNQPALFIAGEEGCGKTTICNFLIDFIYGSQISNSDSCLDGLFNRFNGSLENSCLYIVNDVASLDSKNHKGLYGKLRSLIRDRKIMIERKGEEKFQTVNYAKFIFTSAEPTVIKIKKDDRHFVPVECSNKYCRNGEYFDVLRTSFNQEMADHLFSLLMEMDLSGFKVGTIPATKLRRRIIGGDDGSIDEYLADIVDSNWVMGEYLPRPLSVTYHIDKKSGESNTKRPFTPSYDIMDDYFIWRQKTGKKGKVIRAQAVAIIAKKYPEAYRNQRIPNKKNATPGFFIDLLGLPVEDEVTTDRGIPSIPNHLHKHQ